MGDVILLARLVKFFLEETFQLRGARPRSCLALHLMNEVAASLPIRMSFRTSVRASLERPLRAGASRKAPGTGWLEGRRGLPRTLFPVKRLFAAKFSLRAPGGRSPHVAEARDRLSPIGSARQDQFMGARPPQRGDSAHRSWREQTPGATEPGAIASEP